MNMPSIACNYNAKMMEALDKLDPMLSEEEPEYISPEENDDQDSPGVLTLESLQTVSRSLQEIAIRDIQRINDLPDFTQPMMAEWPIIAKTPQGYFCLDGWKLIEEAIAAGQETIRVEVDELAAHSDVELCLRKAAIRSVTRGGLGSYIEHARNARNLLKMLMETQEGLVVYQHGGNRTASLSGNREDDARAIIALRMGKNRDTINTYLAHAEYLSDAFIQTCVLAEMGKDFFEAAQKEKRKWIGRFKEENLTDEEISAKISDLMQEFYAVYVTKRGKKGSAKKKVKIPQVETPAPESAEEEVSAENLDNIDDGNLSEALQEKEIIAPKVDSSTILNEQKQKLTHYLSELIKNINNINNVLEFEKCIERGISTLLTFKNI